MKHKFVPFIFVCGAFALPALCTLLPDIQQTSAPDVFNSGIDIYISRGSLVSCMDLDEYLIGVVAASADAACHPETLKAMAVIARTNITGILGSRKSVNADELNQPYMSPSALKSRFGTDFNTIFNKYKAAVAAVPGEIITYNGTLALAPFFKCGTGKTRASESVFGSALPYLISIDSPADAACPNARSVQTVTCEDFISCMLSYDRNFFATPDSLADTVQIIETDDAGYVRTVQAGNLSISGDDFRYLFNLPSSAFTLKISGGNVTFTTTGEGHGVGFSQYGADAMAREGKTYKDLLAFYYPGTAIE